MSARSASSTSFSCCTCSPSERCASASWRRRARSSSACALGGAGRGAAAGRARRGRGVSGSPSCAPATPATSASRQRASRGVLMAAALIDRGFRAVKVSRPEALEQAGEGDRLAHVVEAAQPGDAALDAHAEAGVRHGAVAAEIEVPAEGVERELVPSDLRLEHGGVVLALAAANDLAVALRREHVDAEGEARIGRVGLHVEGLRLHRIAVHHHRAVELLRERRLLVAAEIGAPLEREAFLVQDVERLGVGDAREGLLDARERCEIAAEGAQLGLAALAHRADHVHEEVLGQGHVLLEAGEGHLGLDHPELGEMPARLRLLGAEGRAEAVHPAEGHCAGLGVELTRLRQVRRLVEVLDGTAYLTQSGQLYAEAGAMAFGRVYCFGPTFRAEKSKTRRHLTEFWMVEPEMAWNDSDANMRLQEEFVSYIVTRALERRNSELAELERDVKPLETVRPPFPRISYTDAVAKLKALGSDIEWGRDLGGEAETLLAKQYDRPVMVFNYPKAVKAFYMKENPADPRTVLNNDMLAPEGYGEIIGGSQREDDYDKLLARIRAEQLPEDAYSWYLDLRKYGTFVHAGFGLGVERTVAWICGIPHIREAIAFPRTLYKLWP